MPNTTLQLFIYTYCFFLGLLQLYNVRIFTNPYYIHKRTWLNESLESFNQFLRWLHTQGYMHAYFHFHARWWMTWHDQNYSRHHRKCPRNRIPLTKRIILFTMCLLFSAWKVRFEDVAIATWRNACVQPKTNLDRQDGTTREIKVISMAWDDVRY